jgi:ribosome assembly protein SQT1
MTSNHPEPEHDAIADENEFIDSNDVLIEVAEDDGVEHPVNEDDEDIEDIIYEDTSVQRFTNHADSVFTVAAHPSAKIAASGGEDDLGYIWDYATGEELVKLTGHTDSVTNIGFNHDGEMVATGGMDGKVRVWKRVGEEDFKKWTFLTELQGPDEVTVSFLFSFMPVFCTDLRVSQWMRWHPKGNVLLAGSEDSTVWLWNCKYPSLEPAERS